MPFDPYINRTPKTMAKTVGRIVQDIVKQAMKNLRRVNVNAHSSKAITNSPEDIGNFLNASSEYNCPVDEAVSIFCDHINDEAYCHFVQVQYRIGNQLLPWICGNDKMSQAAGKVFINKIYKNTSDVLIVEVTNTYNKEVKVICFFV